MARTGEMDIAHVATLSRIDLTPEEAALFQAQLEQILKYAEKLSEVDVSHVETAAHTIPIFNVFRDDESRDWFTAQEALSNAPHQANGLFVVTKVVE